MNRLIMTDNFKFVESRINKIQRDFILRGKQSYLMRITDQPGVVPFKQGIKNLGNTCYINATLQCLFSTESFVDKMIETYERFKIIVEQDEFAMMNALMTLIADKMMGSKDHSTNVKRFINSVRINYKSRNLFTENVQEDAQEFLLHLMTYVDEALIFINQLSGLQENEKYASLQWKQSSLETKTCSKYHKNNVQVTENMLSLPVEQCHSVARCLDKYFSAETMNGSDGFRCNTCKKKVNGSRRVAFTHLDRFLIIHLKRFKQIVSFNYFSLHIIFQYSFIRISY